MKFKSFMSLLWNMCKNCRSRQIFTVAMHKFFTLAGYVLKVKFWQNMTSSDYLEDRRVKSYEETEENLFMLVETRQNMKNNFGIFKHY